MIMLLKISIMIQNEVFDNYKIIKYKLSLSGSSNLKADDNTSSFRVVTNLINCTGVGDDSSIMNLIQVYKRDGNQ